MAGIGFALNKLVNKKSFLGKISGYFYTASSCLGSMILGFALLFMIQFLSKILGQDAGKLEIFTSYVTNMVFLSMILFSIFSLVLSRYISDMIYERKENHIMPSFWGVISIIVPISYIIAIPILMISKIEPTQIFLLLVLLAEFVSTWVATLYVTIIKKYKKITLTFGIAILLSAVILIICYYLKKMTIEIMLITIISSYGIVLVSLTRILQKEFVKESMYTYEFTKWFSRYPLLAFTGLFSTLGTLIHFYIMWFGSSGKEIQGLMHGSPSYDMPAIIAYFSTIITSITFIAVLEPNFYGKYSKYFKLLNTTGTYEQLKEAKKEMQSTLRIELRNLILKQIVCTLVFVILISKIISNLNIGMTQSMIECFKVLCIGYSIYAIANVILQMQLYFSDNKGAFCTATIFLVTTTIGTIVSVLLDSTFWGTGIVLGSACMAIFGSERLEDYIDKLEYNVLNSKEENKRSRIYAAIKKSNISARKISKNKITTTIANAGSILILFVILCVSLYRGDRVTTKIFELEDNGEILSNAGVGLAPWAKNEATLNMDTELVYIDLSWAEWEPSEGKFDEEYFETKNHIEEYKKQGRQAVFRFYMDYPSEEKHMDIPQWLYKKIKRDGTWYDNSYGKGFSPNYNNEILIEYHKKAIEALANKYGNDDFFIYIELGSIGHWGEWHVNYEEGVEKLPDYEIRKQYITPYTENFKNSTFLMRYSIGESKEYNCGLYNDMLGDMEETEYWFDGMNGNQIWDQTNKNELVNNLETWKVLPIGGEFASSYDNSYFLKEHLDITLLLLKKSHQSFIGPKIIIDEKNSEDYSKAMNEILKILGHRIYAQEVEIEQINGQKLKITANITNSGIAPIYEETQLAFSVYDISGNLITKAVSTDFDARTVLPDEVEITESYIDTSNFEKGQYYLCMSLEDKETGEPIVELPMDSYKDNIYKIGQFSW